MQSSETFRELLVELKKAQKLASQFTGGYSERFFDAEEFAHALDATIIKLEGGDIGVLENLSLWFLPTSDWDDLIKIDGFELGQRISELIEKYLTNQ